MKKALLALLLVNAVPALAENAPAQPTLYTGTITVENRQPTINNKTEFSRSKRESFCWLVQNTDTSTAPNINETFVSPQATEFEISVSQRFQQLKTTTSADKTQHSIQYVLNTPNLQPYNCWTFTPSDPIGEYRFTLKVNNFVFPEQTFQVTP
ncbi:hypothetical protein QG071_07090 [Kingella kingae]|uniref:hypothetical protein n=1 Tax=Kingella kingae TaxID=504 RepID=UPI0002FF4629|nr:hypothetical protein [Kingella kingae]MDK4555785.1 hypothetical protein [Kingella kingae]MDK4584883.1 hypothetical protein [Kingella kingae]MDK4588894.1 hypothetical protein [Kingella kingae]MDK4595927.1 hypothetical protein [Kingella kingae]MDK4599857.1 hypothetical protein [Kingella kingae]